MLPIKTRILDKMTKELPYYSLELMEKVIAFQGEDMLRATREYREIEISGFGLLFVAKGKLARRIKLIEKALSTVQTQFEQAISEEDKEKEQKKIESFTDNLNFLKSKCRN